MSRFLEKITNAIITVVLEQYNLLTGHIRNSLTIILLSVLAKNSKSK